MQTRRSQSSARSSAISRRSPRRRSLGVGRVMVLSFVLLMLVLPVTSRGASASDEDLIILDDQIQVETELNQELVLAEDETPTPEPNPELELNPDIAVDQDLDVLDPGDNTPVPVSDIYVNKHVCEPGTDVTLDYYGLAAACQPDDPTANDNWEFWLYDEWGNPWGSGYTSGGGLSFSGVTPGNYELFEVYPADYAFPAIFCNENDSDGNEVGESFFVPQPYIPVKDGNYYFCDVYNFPPADEYGSIIIYKFECPQNFDIWSGNYEADCAQPLNGVQFNAFGPNGYAAQTNTGDSIDGAVMFGGIEAGSYELVETIPSGFTGAYVMNCASNIMYVAPFEPKDVSADGSFQWDLQAGEKLECFWYNVPGYDGTVVVKKWQCPVGLDLSNLDVDYYLENCTEVMEGIDFTLSGPSGDSDGTTDASGEVTWTGVEPGYYDLVESLPSGYGDPFVYCRWGGYGNNNGSLFAVDGFVGGDFAAGGSLPFEVYDYSSFGMYCNWFNFPYDPDQDITIYKYTCPEGYDIYAAWADPQTDCAYLTNGVNFTLEPNGGVELQSMTGDSINGAVYFGGVDPTSFKVWEDAPAGTIATYVTCQWYEDLGPYRYEEMTLSQLSGSDVNNFTSFELSEGDSLICQWYNVPEKTHDNGKLTIIKYWCQGYVISTENCQLGSGVKFVINAADGSGGPILVETGNSGSVSIELPKGGWTVAEKDYEWCKAVATDVDVDGTVLTKENHETVLTVYNCTDNPPTKEPLKKLPNTGAGATATASAPAQQLSTELLAILAGAAQLGLVVLGRSGRLSPTALINTFTRR